MARGGRTEVSGVHLRKRTSDGYRLRSESDADTGQELERVCQRWLSLRCSLERDGVLRLLPFSAVRERAGELERDSVFDLPAQELDGCLRYSGPVFFLSGCCAGPPSTAR